MSVSVDLPGCGRFVVSLTPSRTADDIVLRLRERLADQPWHGNKVLSYGHRQLRPEDVVEAAYSPLVLSNYSEISNEDWQIFFSVSFCSIELIELCSIQVVNAFCSMELSVFFVFSMFFLAEMRCVQEVFSIQDTAERGITREQLAKLVVFISKMADGWCETFGEHRGKRLQVDTFNLYHANFWIIKPATEGYGTGSGCSLVEIMAVCVQRPDWFVSHAWIEPRFEDLTQETQ